MITSRNYYAISFRIFSVVMLLLAAPFSIAVHADTPPSTAKILLDKKPGAEKLFTPSSKQVVVSYSENSAAPGVAVTIQPGEDGYPGVSLKPAGMPWDLSAFGHVEARIVNTGTKPLSLALRLDNAGDWKDNPWNTESITLEPGASGTLKTIFGYAYGYQRNFPLKPSAVVNLLLFAGKSDTVQSFRIESLQASGPAGEKPPVPLDAIRIKPVQGILLGTGVTVDAATQIATQNVQAALTGAAKQQAIRVTFPASTGEQSVSLKPAQGRWDLRDKLEVRVAVRNTGKTPVVPRVRLETNGGPSEWITAPAPLSPGAERVITVPFAGPGPVKIGIPGGENRVTSDAVSAITISAESGTASREFVVESITAGMPPAPALPDWLGKRPPVAGDWVKTLDDEFNGNTVDSSIWNVSGPNYWDKTSHWSKNNTIIGGGVVRLRYEKKTGYQNDDPKEKQSNYASGFMETYGKWTQRYGYFEARMKLPSAPGLWPAFWMMPDRGVAAVGQEQWKRQDTANGGMEFDVMEHLTRWGGNRYNIAMHYDGYDKDHKNLGSDHIYAQPDKDGFITCGLLWIPGSAIYYCNGREVARWETPRISNVASDLMFTLPMGGWDNSPLEDALLPADFVIDYVRVWQRKDLASPVDGKKSNRTIR